MKKKFLKSILIAAALLVFLDWFYFTGKEINGLSDINADCEIEIIREYEVCTSVSKGTADTEHKWDRYYPDDKQKEQIVELIKNTYGHWIIDQKWISKPGNRDLQPGDIDPTTEGYMIRVDFKNGHDFMNIDVTWGDYISYMEMGKTDYSPRYRIIGNIGWNSRMREILGIE
ncbi:MAG: hypothetical protein IJF53_06740 [Clostridia bacterium]|nr:hypothetical protein [Clostridia bacterium]